MYFLTELGKAWNPISADAVFIYWYKFYVWGCLCVSVNMTV